MDTPIVDRKEIIGDLRAANHKLGAEIMIEGQLYKPIVYEGDIFWDPVKKNEDVAEDILDEFKPDAFTFFIIGNEAKCRPCADSIKDIELFMETSEDNVSMKKWEYDMDSRNVIGKIKQAWIRRMKQNNEKFRNYTTIPQIWHKGEFIGGHKDLRQILADLSIE